MHNAFPSRSRVAPKNHMRIPTIVLDPILGGCLGTPKNATFCIFSCFFKKCLVVAKIMNFFGI